MQFAIGNEEASLETRCYSSERIYGSTNAGTGDQASRPATSTTDHAMKKIETIIKPSRVGAMQQALSEAGITGLTMSDVRGMGRHKDRMLYRGNEYVVDFIPKVKLEIVVSNELVSRVVNVIRSVARSAIPAEEIGAISSSRSTRRTASSRLRRPSDDEGRFRQCSREADQCAVIAGKPSRPPRTVDRANRGQPLPALPLHRDHKSRGPGPRRLIDPALDVHRTIAEVTNALIAHPASGSPSK